VGTNRRRPRAGRHLSVWTEPPFRASAKDDDADRLPAALTDEVLGSLAVVRGIASLLLEEATLSTAERDELLRTLDRQAGVLHDLVARVTVDGRGPSRRSASGLAALGGLGGQDGLDRFGPT
jgi:hypothetical protein